MIATKRITISRVILVTLLLLVVSSLAAGSEKPSNSQRERLGFNEGWSFRTGDPEGTGDALSYLKTPAVKDAVIASASTNALSEEQHLLGSAVPFTRPDFNDKEWRHLDLPHDWAIEGPFNISSYVNTGRLPWCKVGWYRKTFTLPATDAGRRVYLDIDGAMSYSMVWCNGRFVGGWPYGYSSFRLDLTSYIKPGEKNTLAIRLDNTATDSRWYPGGGLFRNLWLVKTSPVHVAQWGVEISTPEVGIKEATVRIKTKITNSQEKETPADLKVELFELDEKLQKAGRPVAMAEANGTLLPAGKSTDVTTTAKVDAPRLWSTKTPSLYAAVVTIRQAGEVKDTYETRFGIRTIEFKAESGFWLNGERVQIKGVCLHHDLGALGTAWNRRAAERQLQIMKEMGFNALRTSHNPPAPELLDLCDQMGIVVMDEAFDCWKLGKNGNDYNKLWDEWHERDLRALIRRDFNHPCVILWGLGNEIVEFRSNKSDTAVAIATGLSAIARDADPTRPSTLASANIDQAPFNGVQKTVGVMGANYRCGEYGRFKKENPTIPFIASETASAVSSRGEYVFQSEEQTDEQNRARAEKARASGSPVPAPIPHTPVSPHIKNTYKNFQIGSYDFSRYCNLPEEEFKQLEKNPFVAGEFVWTGFDYLGEPVPFNHPTEGARSSYFGIVDLAGFPKDRYYLYQAHWRPELPMVHILPHWNWPDRVGKVTPVHVYTSGDEVELFLNGKSLGRKKKAPLEYRLRWDDVVYEPGELKAVAYKNGKQWAEETVRTTGSAAKLTLEPDRSTISNDGRDLSFVKLTVRDKDGLPVPRACPAVTFAISGPGEIVATDNGDATDLTTFSNTTRKAYNGLALAIVRSKKGESGPITLKATSEGLTSAETTINAR